jgi:diacylglycerol O-acyltransferase
MRIGVAVLTYAGEAAFGITADFASVPEVKSFADAVVDEVAKMHQAAVPPAPADVVRPTRRPRSGGGQAGSRRAAAARVAQLS